MTMDDRSQQASRALVEGDRTKMEDILQNKERTGGRLTVQDYWMLGTSLEDEEKRREHLKFVQQSGQQPYAQMATDILKREKEFEDELNERGPIEKFVHRWRPVVLRIIIAGIIFAGVLVFALWFFSPPQAELDAIAIATAEQIAIAETQAVLALTPTVTPVPTNLPGNRQGSVDYTPVGAFQVLSWDANTQLTIGRNNNVAQPPQGAKFVAIKYAFTCKPGLNNQGICNNPPEVEQIRLLLNNSNRVTYDGHYVIGGEVAGSAAVGQVVEGWLAFPIPQNTTPTVLELDVRMSMDRNEAPQTFTIPLS